MHAVPPMPTFMLWTGLLGGEVMLKAVAQGMPDVYRRARAATSAR